MTLITTTTDLAFLCDRLRAEPFVTIDTEFMRDRTFWPKLCLVQIAGAEEAVAIDPLASGIDLAPLLDLMADPAVLKVFHAARQDLEIFVRLMGKAPAPIFDTQIAAMVCGFGEEVAYDTLVAQVAKARIDKTSRFTDWARRPLTDAQLRYALGDVTHLRVVYQGLIDRLEQTGRVDWVVQEMADLTDPALYAQEPDQAWRRLKVRSREPRFLAVVQALAAWREREAQRRDLPRNRIMRDDLLLEVAASRPKTAEDVARLPRLGLDARSCQAVASVVTEALALPPESLPRLPEPVRPPRGIGPLVELLRVLLKLQAEEHNVAQRLIATSGDLELIAQDDGADVPALAGWRRELFGEAALSLKHGRLGFAVRGGKVRLLPLPETEAA
ncbi:ribonuclease D [Marinivivus vitaminiproducens]|uniref:ribonuclease D n=1 Tax=Marinivivus vitaminiproducens TaxID=3035935 RepID=UPI0027A9F160|nr:ribonuclease D [Geminicoccaceae bacterium SCSIO 64248]